MGYLHIENLYQNKDILLFRECYALEKIHGTSQWIHYCNNDLGFYAGGIDKDIFEKLFDKESLLESFRNIFELNDEVFLHGEGYGGKCQKMSDTYGKDIKFIAFDVKVNNSWLSVENAFDVSNKLKIEFVDFVKIPAEIEAINFERDKPSTQAKRNGILEDKLREGVILRPLIEVTKNNGSRIICKHKHEKFRETKTPRSTEISQVLTEAKAIADEWVTEMRLEHVLDKLPGVGISDTKKVIEAMVEDVQRESIGEVVWSKDVSKAIGNKTAKMFVERIKQCV